jgi:hypothetical protein
MVLSRVLTEFKQTNESLDPNDLSNRLSIERTALEGMLQLLVRQRKLRETGPGTEACSHCGGYASCAQTQMANVMGKSCELANQVGRNPPTAVLEQEANDDTNR